MDPGERDFNIVRGNDWSRLFRFKDGNGVVIDLTGSEMVFRAVNAAGEEIVRQSTNDEIAMDDPTSGEILISISKDDSRLFPTGKLSRYELERRIDGSEITLLMGSFNGIGGVNDDAA